MITNRSPSQSRNDQTGCPQRNQTWREPSKSLPVSHIEKLKEARREEALNSLLADLEAERQHYLDAIEESETLISKLKERNVDSSIIADEQTLID